MASTQTPADHSARTFTANRLHLVDDDVTPSNEVEHEMGDAADNADDTFAAVHHAAATGLALFADDEVTEDVDRADRESMDRTASMILSAMDAAGEHRDSDPYTSDRREPEITRAAFRATAELRLFADPEDAEPWVVYLRDVEARAAGFICPDRLPLGYGGTLSFTDNHGDRVEVDVTLVRCRVCYAGWFEGALYFHRNQPQLLTMAEQTSEA